MAAIDSQRKRKFGEQRMVLSVQETNSSSLFTVDHNVQTRMDID
jgi:hypothetical protein